MTTPRQKILHVFHEFPGPQFGYDLAKRAGVRSAVMYRVLDELLAEGVIRNGREDPFEAAARPPRRYYELQENRG